MSLPNPADSEEVSVRDVAGWISLSVEERPRLVDCREAEELEICQIEGNEWLPLGDIPSSVDSFRKDMSRGIVVYCHHGMRSLQATRYLRKHGLENVFSMSGGIDAWSRTIDPTIHRY